MRKCLIVGLNPALQRTINVGQLSVGSVNRALSVNIGIGGKGQDVYVAASMMGLFSESTSAPLIAQFLGQGSEGDTISKLLAVISHDKILESPLTVRSAAPLRTCITIVDSSSANEATEIVEPSGTILPSEIEVMRSIVKSNFEGAAAGGVAVMGSMPPGCPADLYSTLLSDCCDAQSKVLLDTATSVISTIKILNEKGSKVMLKLNARELCQLVSMPVQTGAEAAAATSEAKITAAADRLLEQLHPMPATATVFVASTDGPYSAYLNQLSPQRRRWRIDLPPLPRELRNAIGAGDAVSAGTVFAWQGAFRLEDWTSSDLDEGSAFAWGLACGAASCLTDKNSVFDIEDAKSIFSRIKKTEITT